MIAGQCLSFDSKILCFILSVVKHDRWMKFLDDSLNLHRRKNVGSSYVGIASAYSQACLEMRS